MGYRIDLGAWNGIFAVPCDLVDRQLKLAGAVQLKALLYILRHSGRAVEISELAQVLSVSEGDAADAVAYWQQEGLITCRGEELAPAVGEVQIAAPVAEEVVCASASIAAAPVASAPEVIQPETPAVKPSHPAPKAKERIRYSYNECAEMMSKDGELRQMLSILEGILSKNLNHTEISVFITLVKWYGLPTACVAMLVEYCREIGKSSIAYIETTGIGWVNEEITTIEQVDCKIAHLRAARSAWSHLRAVLDIPERSPTKKEQECCSLWFTEWNISDELVLLAYERCINSKGKLSMSYMNGIISNWRKNGITTAEQAAERDQNERRTSLGSEKNTSSKSSAASKGMYESEYDSSEIEAMLDDDWLDEA